MTAQLEVDRAALARAVAHYSSLML